MGEALVDGGGVASIPWMMGGDCWFILEVEVVVFEPVCDGMACGGGAGCVGQGALPPWVVCVEVAHY